MAISSQAVRQERETQIQKTHRDELTIAIIEAIRALPSREREIFVLRRYAGATAEQIAERMSLGEKDVHDLLESANRQFYTQLRWFPSKWRKNGLTAQRFFDDKNYGERCE